MKPEERLEALRAAHDRARARWTLAREALALLGETVVTVPRPFVDAVRGASSGEASTLNPFFA